MINRRCSTRRVLASSAAGLAVLASPAVLAETDSGELEVIVVTAQKRSENIQSVPASVTAVSGAQLQERNLESLADYQAYLPGLNVATGGSPGQSAVSLRGVAPVGPGSVVGFYIDDTPIGSSANYARATLFAPDMGSYELDRLEVLNGPQGTLYGAGAMGGLVKYVLRTPALDDFTAQFGGDVASVNHAGDPEWALRAAVNAPIVKDRLAIRLSAYDHHQPGYIDNAYDGDEDVNAFRQYGGRLAALWQPTEALSIKFNALWQRAESDDNSVVSLGDLTEHPSADDAYFVSGRPIYGELSQYHAFEQPFSKDLDYYSATINWDLGPVTAISATSWSRSTMLQISDAPTFGLYYPLLTGGAIPAGLSRFDLQLDLDKFTQELRLVSRQGGTFEWLVGGYYTDESSENVQKIYAFDNDYNPIPVFSPYFAFAMLPSSYQEYAFFGDLTYRFLEKWDATVGVRYAHNEQDFHQITGGAILPDANVPGTSSEGVTTWMGSLSYHVNDDVMVYARAATGFRPGGPNVTLPGVPPTVDSDSLTNYEIGLKAEFLDRTVLFDLTAFHIDWNDIQATVSSGGVNHLSNVGDAETEGLELQSAWRPLESLTLGLNASYTNAEATSLVPDAPPIIVGYQLPGVPEWAASLTADYDFELADWQARVGGGLRYTDETYTGSPMVRSLGGTATVVLPSYTSLDLNASIRKDRLSLKLFVRNLTDERAYQGGGVIADPFENAFQIDVAVLQPRTIGIGADFNF